MTVETYIPSSLTVDRASVCRYLHYRQLPDPPVMERLDAFAAQAEREASFRAVFAQVPVTVKENSVIFDGFSQIESRKLADNLRGTSRAMLFCATCGVFFDRKIAQSALEPASAVLWDAVGTAAIEQLCDELCAEKKTVRPRFSPGYGDLPLTFQKEFLQWLNAARLLGVGLTDSLLMTPTKSVTAIAALE